MQHPTGKPHEGRSGLRAGCAAIFFGLTITACAPVPSKPATADVDGAWLDRITYGVDSASLARYRRLGKEGFLDEQLGHRLLPLPAFVQQQIDTLEISHTTAPTLLTEAIAAREAIDAAPEGTPREQARKRYNERGNDLAQQAAQRHLLRVLYSQRQLEEKLVWFWLNHFSVYQHKGHVRWLVADYEDRAIRPHVSGKFRDLVLATIRHPAMLEYLDNARNAIGHVNENYARELLELHTLGVDGGYSQQDVQALARILTGVGVATRGEAPALRREWRGLYQREGGFEFNPRRHDFGNKMLLGQRIAGGGFAEVEAAVDLIVRQPACAQFISRKLALYFVSDTPRAALITQMAATFRRSDGDLAAVLRTMLTSSDFKESLGTKFKDPMQYMASALRLAYDGRTITNMRPAINWLATLGEPLYGRQTPDGYGLDEASWASPGQLSKRFEVARAIAAGNAALFESMNGAPAKSGLPQLQSRVYYDVLEPKLTSSTRAALDRAGSQAEWNTFLLASPDFGYH